MDSNDVLKEIENLAGKKFLPIIGPVKGKLFVKIIRKFKIKKVLEVGTLVGYSSILIAKHLPEAGRVITIEINPVVAKIARENIKKAGFSGKIKVFIGDAKKVIPKVKEKFDTLFLDAVKEEYLDYLNLAEKNLKKGSVVIADNAKIFADEMAGYLKYVRTSGKYKSRTVDFGFDAVEVSIKS